MTVRELMRALAQYPFPDDQVVFRDVDGRRMPLKVTAYGRTVMLQKADAPEFSGMVVNLLEAARP